MTALTFSHGETLIIVDGQVLEVFKRRVEGSNRIPLVWLGVWLDTRNPDRLRISVGAQTTAGRPVYSEQPQELAGFSRLPVEAAAVPQHRTFFAEVAAVAGRPFE